MWQRICLLLLFIANAAGAQQSGFTDFGRDKILKEARESTGRGKL
jgi:hypothetical protein